MRSRWQMMRESGAAFHLAWILVHSLMVAMLLALSAAIADPAGKILITAGIAMNGASLLLNAFLLTWRWLRFARDLRRSE